MERELALEFVRVTEAAALSSARWMGRGDKMAADDAATSAMRAVFDTIQMDGVVVIGEGEMDEAPMLYIGEKLGTGSGPALDVAVDPLEGTSIVAKGMNGAIAVLAIAPRGCLLNAPDMYMDKIAVGPKAAGKIDINAPVEQNLRAVAEAEGKELSDLTVVVLDRPRHSEIINTCRQLGVRIKLISDGDVSPAVAAAIAGSGVDMVLGIGGAPEGVLAAAALKCLGGEMQGRLIPMDDEERERAAKMGISDLSKVLYMDDLVRGNDVIFAATGITDGDMLKGVQFTGHGATTYSIVMRAKTGTVRFVEAIHRFDKKPNYGQIIKPCGCK